jgi:hypothetical protein
LRYGSLRIIYGIAELLGLAVGIAPLPLQAYTGAERLHELPDAIEKMMMASPDCLAGENERHCARSATYPELSSKIATVCSRVNRLP